MGTLLAAVALVVTSAGAVAYFIRSRSSQSQPAAPRAFDAKRTEWPCLPGSDDRASDLCAQWRAADAAEESAYWAEYALYVGGASLLLSGAGLVALLRTLRQTDKSLRLAQRERATATRRAVAGAEETAAAIAQAERTATAILKANEIARDAQRAWVSLEIEPLSLKQDKGWVEFRIELIAKNTGLTAAENFSLRGICFIDSGVDHEQEVERKLREKLADNASAQIILPPSCHQRLRVAGMRKLDEQARSVGEVDDRLYISVAVAAFYTVIGEPGTMREAVRYFRMGDRSPTLVPSLPLEDGTWERDEIALMAFHTQSVQT